MQNVIRGDLLQRELPRETVIRWALMRVALDRPSITMRQAANPAPGLCLAGSTPFGLCPLGGWGCDQQACPWWSGAP